jgi:hypothetical protein
MKPHTLLTPQIAFWGHCLIGLGWIAATILFELHLGWPITATQWIKRPVGWGIEFLLARTLVIGARRCAVAR